MVLIVILIIVIFFIIYEINCKKAGVGKNKTTVTPNITKKEDDENILLNLNNDNLKNTASYDNTEKEQEENDSTTQTSFDINEDIINNVENQKQFNLGEEHKEIITLEQKAKYDYQNLRVNFLTDNKLESIFDDMFYRS